MPLIRIKEMRKLPALTRNQVRAIDKTAIAEYGMPGVVLMENAGSRAAILVNQLSPPGPIEILCGGGNNGGDGYGLQDTFNSWGEVSVSSALFQ